MKKNVLLLDPQLLHVPASSQISTNNQMNRLRDEAKCSQHEETKEDPNQVTLPALSSLLIVPTLPCEGASAGPWTSG